MQSNGGRDIDGGAVTNDCVFDDELQCIYCGYQARKPNTRRNCGVTERPAPGVFDKVSRYASAVRRWIAAGRPVRSDAEVDQLLAICQGCEHFDGSACKKCGCRVNRSSWGLLNKARMTTEPCPAGHWPTQSRSEPDERLRVGFVTPNLLYGGVDSWIASLCREWASSDSPIRVNGVAHVGGIGSTHEDMLREIGRDAPIVSSIDSFLVHRVATPDEAIYAIAERCDVLIVWSVSGSSLPALQASGAGVIVGVSHGCSDWWMRGAASVVTHWAAVSREAALACPSRPVEVIPNGVDWWRCAGSKLSWEEARDRLRIPRTAKVAGYVGRFAAEKNTAAIRAAVDLLPPDWLGLFCGRGDRIEPGPRVRVIEPQRLVGDVWAACDVAVMASSTEGHSLSADEALLCGVPLVSTRVGTVAELGEDAATWIDEVTPEAIAAAIVRACGSPVSDRVCQLVRSDRSATAMASRWAQYLASFAALPVPAQPLHAIPRPLVQT